MRVACLVVALLCLIPACQKSPVDGGSGGSSASGGGDFGTPGEILDRAIAAYGGNPAWEKLKTCRIHYRTITRMPGPGGSGGENTVLTEDCYQYPDKLRRIVRRESDGKQMLLSVVNGSQMWLLSADNKLMTQPCSPEMACPPAIATLGRLMQLRASSQAMKVEPAIEIDGRKVLPLTMLQDGVPRSTTCFDPSTWLAVKEVKYLPDVRNLPESLKRQALAETTYGEYKNFDGAFLPTLFHAYQEGQIMFEARILEVDYPASFPAELFDAPKAEVPSGGEAK